MAELQEDDRYSYTLPGETPPVAAGPAAGEYVITMPPGHDRLVKPPTVSAGEAAGETAKDALRSGVNSMWMGGGNRIVGGVNYLAGTSKAGSLGGAIDEAVAEEDAGRARSPYATTAAELAGGTLTGLAIPGPGPGASTAARVWSGMKGGTALGAAQGAGNTYTGNPADYVGHALTGGIYGGLLGGAAPIMGSIAGGGGTRVWDAMRRDIPGPLGKAAQADEAGLLALQSRHGPNARLPDAGPAMLAQGQGAVLNPQAPGASALINELNRRKALTGNRITEAVDNIYGRAPVPEHIDPQIGERMQELGPAYERALNRARAVDTEPVANWLDAQIVNSRGPAQAALRQARDMLNITGNPEQLDPHPRVLQQARTAVQGMATASEDPAVRRALGLVDRQLTEELQTRVPGIRALDHAYAELGAQQRAIANNSPGARIFDTGRTNNIRPPVLEDIFREASQPKGVNIGPSAEAFRLQQAARAELDRKVANKPSVVTLDEVLGKDEAGNSNARRLDAALGANRTSQLEGLRDTEAAFRNSQGKIVEGSQTAHKLAAKEGQDELSLSPAAASGHSLYGDLKSGGLKLLREFADRTNISNRDKIASILATRDPQEIQALIPRLLAEQPTREARAAVVQSLVSRGMLGASANVIGKRRNQPL